MVRRKDKRMLEGNTNYFFEFLKIKEHFFKNMNLWLKKVTDHRHQSYKKYDAEVILFMMILKNAFNFKSMRSMTDILNQDQVIENLEKALDVALEELPHYDTINDFLEELPPEELEKIRTYMIRELLKKRCFENYRIQGKYWGIIFDGTGIFKFDEKHCEHCLKRKYTNKETGETIISVNDPEMKHGHKTSSRNSDGYKAEIITGGELASIIVAVEVDGANTEDGWYMGTLIDEATNDGVDIKKIYGDSSYSDFEEIEKRKNEVEFCVKVRSSHNGAGGYTKEKFEIDLKNGTVTCPEGNVKKFEAEKVLQQRKQTMVHFSEKTCRDCPQREKCTQCKDGRRILIHPYEDKLHEQRMYQKTEEFKEDYNKRANVERTISHVTAHGGRKSRYKGKKKTKWQLIMASINHNIKMVMGYIKNKPKQDTTMGELCPQMS